MTADQTKDRFTRLSEKLAKEPRCTPEEQEAFAAERRTMEGKWLETVTMNEDRSLMIVTTQYFVGGGKGHGCTESAPGDPDYEELLEQHGGLKPGQTHTIVRKMINGEWVVQANETDAAKSA